MFLVKDLGELEGDVLLFGGSYSNAHALGALFDIAEELDFSPKNRICTGDAVAYCGAVLETLELMENACEWLAGNCEKQLVAQADTCGCGFRAGSVCDVLSKGWFSFASGVIGADGRARMSLCQDLIVFTNRGTRYGVVHGGYRYRSRFLWPSSPEKDFEQEFSALQAEHGSLDAIISGHCGMAFQRNIGTKSWINAGAIGMPPHDGRPQTRYVVLGEDGARIKRLDYDVAAAGDQMRKVGLVQGYEIALKTGYWPSDGILPQALRS